MSSLKIKKGNQYTLLMTLTKDGSAFDVSTATDIVFAITSEAGVSVASAVYSVSLVGGGLEFVTDGTNGQINVYIYSDESEALTSGFYYYVLQITTADGNFVELPDETVGEIHIQEQTLTNP